MATVWLPPEARALAAGAQKLEAAGDTVLEVLRNLERTHPGIGELLMADDALRPGILVAVDGTIGSRRLLQPVKPDSEIHFIPAIFGG